MRNPNTDAIPYTAHVSYRYDGELEFDQSYCALTQALIAQQKAT